MKETINNEIEDLYLEHELHNTYEPKCSECYKFALSIPVGERAFLLMDMKTIENELRPPLTKGDEEQLELCRNCSIPCENLYCDACQHDIEQEPNYFK